MENSKKVTFKGKALRVGLILACVMAVAYLMPREKGFSFDFKPNKPWTHQQLIADYDFPIYKSDEALHSERDSVESLFQPYYNEDALVGKNRIQNFVNDTREGRLKGMPANVVKLIASRLRDIYTAGVVRSEELRAMNDSSVSAIRVVSGREAKSRRLGEIFSTRTAYGYIINGDSGTVSHEQLVQYDLVNYVEANLNLDKRRSSAAKHDLLEAISPTYGLVQRGQKIIDQGEIVTPRTYDILKSLERESQVRNLPEKGMPLILFGQFLLVATAYIAFFVYVNIYRPSYFRDINTFALMLSLITIFSAATMLLPVSSRAIAFLVPFAIVGIFMRIFTDTNTAIYALVATVFISSGALSDPFEFILVNLASGIAAIYALHDLQQRSQLFQTAVIATLVSITTAAAFDLAQGTEPKGFDNILYVYLVVNGVFLLFSYPLMYIVEKLFGFVSSVTLIELSNINNPLLRRLSKEAAGTFNHSMQVANLAADAAAKIGARTLLVRTGALYHDIGKIKSPAFFTENQNGVNPHDQLSPERSAAIIISHVAEGLKLADKYHLPSAVKSFIATHHGRSKAKYFYITWCNSHPDEKPDEETFTYPGPNPSTREQTVLMMADSVEAASRSLKEYSDESIAELVNRIIDSQMEEGYFRNCPITFADIADTKKVFIENLKTIYHSRIQYPEPNSGNAEAQNVKGKNFSNIFGNFRRQQ